MVCVERPTRNTGRVARAFNVITHTGEKDEACSPNSARVTRGLSLKEESDIEYQRHKAQLFANHSFIR